MGLKDHKIVWFTEGGWQGKVSLDNPNMRNDVSIETLVIMNKLNQFVHRNDELLSNDVMWPDISRLIKKYSPFLDVNIDKYKKLTREAYDGYFRT